MRSLVWLDGGRLRLTSRRDRDHADTFPELAGLGGALDARSAVLDGEIICTDSYGRPSFDRLGLRLAHTRRSRYWVDHVPATFVAFDLLALNGTDLCGRPWQEQRRALTELGLDDHPGP